MFKTLALTPAFIGLVLASNDWSKACTNGACSYESGDGVNSAWSAIDVEATPSALSDITTAAGWNIAGCSSSWATGEAKIQLSCSGTAQQVALCDNLFDGGAANKVVRLPQDCGVGPFARVVSTTEVGTNKFDVTLDYDFSKIPSDGTKSLSFTVSSSNVQDGVSEGSALRARHSQPERRYPVALAPRFEIGDTVNLPPIEFSRSFTLLNQTFDCPAEAGGVGVNAGLSIGASVAVKVHSAFGVSVKGSVLPFPKVDSFQLTGTVSGAASALFDVQASVTGSFTTGDIQLFEVGLPGLNFPGILNIGPRFVINTRLDSALELQANVRAGATYKFPEVQLVFPQDQGKSIAKVKPVPEALKLSLEPGVSADGSVEAHLIPGLDFGFEVLGGLASANVFLKVDGSAKLGVSAQASAVISPGSATTGNASGCVDLGAGIAVIAGAEGSIPGIFDEEVSFDIFRQDFDLFQRCFGQGAQRRAVPAYAASQKTRRSMIQAVSASETALTKRQLACPSPGAGGLLENIFNLVRQ